MKLSIFGKEKEYMSYSAMHLWQTSRVGYRKRYYEQEKPFETVETRFGKLLADKLERGDEDVRHIPNYATRELNIEVMIDGNLIKGRIDGFDETRIRFLDHKSAHASKDGKSPWNKLKVRKLDQLPFYSMMLKEKYGKVDSACHLIWIETVFKNIFIEFEGHKLDSQTRELQLTGKVKKFRRLISKGERKRIKEELLKVCAEIKQDYKEYEKISNQQLHVEDSKGQSQEEPAA